MTNFTTEQLAAMQAILATPAAAAATPVAPVTPVTPVGNSKKPLGYLQMTVMFGGEPHPCGSIPVWRDSPAKLRDLLQGTIDGTVDATKQAFACSGTWDPTVVPKAQDVSGFA